MSTITDLSNKVYSLRMQLELAEGDLERALIEASPIKSDSIVTWRGSDYRIVRVCTRERGGLAYWGVKKLKSGVWGSRNVELWYFNDSDAPKLVG